MAFMKEERRVGYVGGELSAFAHLVDPASGRSGRSILGLLLMYYRFLF